jgi:hypothetical protein
MSWHLKCASSKHAWTDDIKFGFDFEKSVGINVRDL